MEDLHLMSHTLVKSKLLEKSSIKKSKVQEKIEKVSGFFQLFPFSYKIFSYDTILYRSIRPNRITQNYFLWQSSLICNKVEINQND